MMLLSLPMLACSSSADPGNTMADDPAVVGDHGEQDPFARPGKQYIPQLGVYLPVLDDRTMEVKTNEVLYRMKDGSMVFSLNWEADPDALFQRFIQGIPVGDKLVITNGQTEDWGKNRTAFGTFFGDPRTGVTDEYRINIWEAGHVKGTFIGVAYFTQADEAIYALAKERLLALLDGVEHLTAAEELEANSAAEQKKRREMEARRTAIGTRKRDAEEARMRQALSGLALVKLNTTVSNSSFGNSSQTTLERFQLCPSGEGSWTFGSDMLIQAERVNTQGDISDVGSMTSTTKNRAIGAWDVERYEGRLFLTIYTYDDQEMNWNIKPGEDAWSYLVGGKVFHVSKAGGTYGPECR
jgi:hypothetical protein